MRRYKLLVSGLAMFSFNVEFFNLNLRKKNRLKFIFPPFELPSNPSTHKQLYLNLNLMIEQNSLFLLCELLTFISYRVKYGDVAR